MINKKFEISKMEWAFALKDNVRYGMLFKSKSMGSDKINSRISKTQISIERRGKIYHQRYE